MLGDNPLSTVEVESGVFQGLKLQFFPIRFQLDRGQDTLQPALAIGGGLALADPVIGIAVHRQPLGQGGKLAEAVKQAQVHEIPAQTDLEYPVAVVHVEHVRAGPGSQKSQAGQRREQ